ncbi:uncharacterized protein YndB with AHSA1/START domain [Amorphus suaedae]
MTADEDHLEAAHHSTASSTRPSPDPALDLVISRRIDAPKALIWRAWTDPSLLEKWWCPRPWRAEVVDFELVPGGAFNVRMHGPEGERHEHPGCFLEIVPEQRIVLTSCLGRGWSPIANPFIPLSAIFTMEDIDGGTAYTATARHMDRPGRDQHEEMGFFEGWGTCIDQLVEVVKATQSRLD